MSNRLDYRAGYEQSMCSKLDHKAGCEQSMCNKLDNEAGFEQSITQTSWTTRRAVASHLVPTAGGGGLGGSGFLVLQLQLS
jgi:hypothetical protein